MAPKFFPTPNHFKEWLEKNHETEEVLWLGYYKKATNIPSITWPESVDEALCYGWIDGLRKRIDDQAYMIRFTPRKPNSHWSKVNIERVKELKKEGRMKKSGFEAFKRKSKKNSKRAAYEQKNVQLDSKFEIQFKSQKKAWTYFSNKAPSYQRQCVWWVMSAKQEATRMRRLNTLIESSIEGKLIPQLRWTEKKKK